MNEHYQNAKKCLDQLLANDQISYYGYVELMLQLDAMKREMELIADNVTTEGRSELTNGN